MSLAQSGQGVGGAEKGAAQSTSAKEMIAFKIQTRLEPTRLDATRSEKQLKSTQSHVRSQAGHGYQEEEEKGEEKEE